MREDTDSFLSSLMTRNRIVIVGREPKDMIAHVKRSWGLTTLEERSKVLEYLIMNKKI